METTATRRTNNVQQRQTETSNRHTNPFLYAAFQTVGDILGAQGADATQYRVESWRGNREGATSYVRVDGESFTGSVHGRVKVEFETKHRTFTPAAEPASRQSGAIRPSGDRNNPLIYAASQTIAELEGAQAADGASYRLLETRGDSKGMSGKVRVDAPTFGGRLSGVVDVRLDKTASYYIPQAEPADVFER